MGLFHPTATQGSRRRCDRSRHLSRRRSFPLRRLGAERQLADLRRRPSSGPTFRHMPTAETADLRRPESRPSSQSRWFEEVALGKCAGQVNALATRRRDNTSSAAHCEPQNVSKCRKLLTDRADIRVHSVDFSLCPELVQMSSPGLNPINPQFCGLRCFHHTTIEELHLLRARRAASAGCRRAKLEKSWSDG